MNRKCRFWLRLKIKDDCRQTRMHYRENSLSWNRCFEFPARGNPTRSLIRCAAQYSARVHRNRKRDGMSNSWLGGVWQFAKKLSARTHRRAAVDSRENACTHTSLRRRRIQRRSLMASSNSTRLARSSHPAHVFVIVETPVDAYLQAWRSFSFAISHVPSLFCPLIF